MGADRRRRSLAPIGIVLVASLVAGCGNGSLEIGTPVNLHVSTTPETVEVDAPGWFADISAVYLCPVAPAQLPFAPADRVGWTPGESCEFMGSYPSREGLTLSLPLDGLGAARRPAFDAAVDWYLVLLDLDGDRVGSAISSRFHSPSEAAGS